MDKLKAGLKKTKDAIFGGLHKIAKTFTRVDEDMLEELEEMLIEADVGVETTEDIIEELRDRIKDGRLKEPEQINSALKEIISGMIGDGELRDLKGLLPGLGDTVRLRRRHDRGDEAGGLIDLK